MIFIMFRLRLKYARGSMNIYQRGESSLNRLKGCLNEKIQSRNRHPSKGTEASR
jgi:hypothetical protein